MRSTFFGLQIGQAGLSTSQFGLDVTSHNIANTETSGFTRQRIVQTALLPSTGFGRALAPQSQLRVGIGTGVRTHDQIRSAFLDRRFRTENSQASYWATRTQEMRYLESFFDSINEETSINQSIARFFDAVKVLSGDVVENAPRTLLRDAGLDMVQQFNMIFNGLVDLQISQNLAIEVKVGEINRIASEIVDLNKSIYIHEITGHIANDLRDARNLLVDQLSSLIDVDYRFIPDENGYELFELSIAGNILLRHDHHALLGVIDTQAQAPGMPSVVQPVWVREFDGIPMASPTIPLGADINDFTEIRMMDGQRLWMRTSLVEAGRLEELNLSMVQGGEIKALVNMRDGDGIGNNPKGIPYYIEMMNNLARSLVQEINRVHSAGWSDHPVEGSQTGINFFHVDGHFVSAFGDEITLNDAGEWVDAGGTVFTISHLRDPANEFTFNYDISQITAANIRLSDELLASPSNIAASSVQVVRGNVGGEAPDLQQGNNNNMRALHELFALRRDFTLEVGGRNIVIGSFDGFATSIRHDVGSTTDLAFSAARNGQTLITAMGNQRESVAGVQLDEEMVSLIRFQHAYSGAARVITAMDDALDRLINGTGRVGL